MATLISNQEFSAYYEKQLVKRRQFIEELAKGERREVYAVKTDNSYELRKKLRD